MNNAPKITLVIPTLNEIDGLKLMIPRIDQSLFDEILVIDAKSTDGTVEYIQTFENINLVTQQSVGLTGAMIEVINIVKTDYIIEFSPDNNCTPEQLPEIVKKIKEGYDIIVISRYLDDAISEDDTLITGIGNWIFSKMIRYLGNFPVTDALTMYRGYNLSVVKDPLFIKYLSTGHIFEPLISAYGNLMNYKYIEIPGTEHKRIGGEAITDNKLNVLKAGLSISIMIMRLYIKKIFKIHI
ncbi:MAG: glycosyltransferase family 2 protein [Gammaproteobacteria bacterium]|jgi:glycosyltransferase involved in cell wall biosynthesis